MEWREPSREFVAGVDVFRVNMSHSSHKMLARYHEIIRGIEARRGLPIGILADLQGPKLRIGTFKDEKVELKAGDPPREVVIELRRAVKAPRE